MVNADGKAKEIVEIASRLIEFGAVSTGGKENPEAVRQAFAFIRQLLEAAGLNVIAFGESNDIPAVYCDVSPPGSQPTGEFLLAGHYDVVAPQQPSQLHPVLDGNWLRGRGAADMLTVAATYIVFMQDLARQVVAGRLEPPPMGLLLVGNEEPGETEPWGTPFVLRDLHQRFGYVPTTIVAGERTGDGEVTLGTVELRNRGIIRFRVLSVGEAGHTAIPTKMTPIDKVVALRKEVRAALKQSRKGTQHWRTTFVVSYLLAGTEGNFNTTATRAVAGFEIRPIPEEPGHDLVRLIEQRCKDMDIQLEFLNREPGVISKQDDARVQRILRAAAAVGGCNESELVGAGKPHGTQARFAPPGCVSVVWGQAGVGPHSANEAHYIPSIEPYYRALWRVAMDL